MTMEELENILKDHPDFSPVLRVRDLDKLIDYFNDFELVDVGENELIKILDFSSGYYSSFFSSKNKVLKLFRLCATHHISVDELKTNINKMLNQSDKEWFGEEISDWASTLCMDINGYPLFEPIKKEQDYFLDDYLFEIDDHIVDYVINCMMHELDYYECRDDLISLKNFIDEILEQRNNKVSDRKYTNSTMLRLLDNVKRVTPLEGEKLEFYRDNLLALAKQGIKRAMWEIGYAYYEGTDGFLVDFKESLFWLEKYYELTKDPDIARTIGYIYYYGRTTDGVPQGDKAFQYFAIGHIAGHSMEATYKLADCYVKGYGTPVNHQAAYNLVNEMFEESLERFLNGDDNKFADIALRLGSYYRDGIYVKKDLKTSMTYYLMARYAIKKRLEEGEYIGDRSVATAISKSIDEIAKEMKLAPRIISDKGIKLPSDIEFGEPYMEFREPYGNVKTVFKPLDNGFISITISRKGNDCHLPFLEVIPEIQYCELVKKINYIVKCPNLTQEKIDKINSQKPFWLGFQPGEIQVLVLEDGEEVTKWTVADESTYVPGSNDYKKQHILVSVEFYSGSKLYDYLCEKKNVSIGDTLRVKANGEIKQVVVREIKTIFEDELPLPYMKMAKAE